MFAAPFPVSFAPATSGFPFTSLVHIDAQLISGADGTPITSTPNLGTAGGNIISGGGAFAPPIKSVGGQNGMRYLLYSAGAGAYNEGDSTLISGLGSTATYTFFCVASLDKPPAGRFLFDGGFGTGATDAHVTVIDQFGISFGRVVSGYLNVPKADYTLSAVRCLSGTVNGGSSIFRLNGLSNVTGTLSTTANAWTSFTLGAESGVYALALRMDLYELVIVNGALSSGDITVAEAYLVNKYGL